MIHEDLLAIQRLWACMEAATQLQQERVTLHKEGEAAAAALAQCEEKLARVRSEIQTHRVEEQRLLQSLKSWQQRRDQTRRMIDEGKAPDFLMAQRQVEGCDSNINDLENQVLSRMEAIEAATELIASTEADLKRRQTRMEQVLHAQSVGLPRIEKEMAALTAERAKLDNDVPTAYRDQLRQLQRMNRSLVASLRDGACGACNYTVAPQILIEVTRGQRVHTCRYCARFLVPAD